MAAIEINYLPKNTEYELVHISKGQTISPVLGSGPERVIQRLGDKSGMSVVVPTISTKKCGPALAVDLIEGKYQGVVIPIPEPKLPVVSYGSPLVDLGGQGGRTLNIKGATPDAVIIKGKWFSIIIGDQRYAYKTRSEVTVGPDGKASLPISPMLRVSPPNNSVIELASPKMEGLVKTLDDRAVNNIGAMAIRFSIAEKR